jgi:hypothetical protein
MENNKHTTEHTETTENNKGENPFTAESAENARVPMYPIKKTLCAL